MKYLPQIYDRGATEQVAQLPDDEQQAIIAEYFAIAQSPGVLGDEQLRPVDTATTVRVEDTHGQLELERDTAVGRAYIQKLRPVLLGAAIPIAARTERIVPLGRQRSCSARSHDATAWIYTPALMAAAR